jgi:sugar porter (SP) family MFS transporter
VDRHLRHCLLLATVVSFGGFVFGFDASVISGAIGFVSVEFGLGAWEQGLVVSAPTLGATIAALAAGHLSDRVGRKKVLIAVAWLYVGSGVWSALATSYVALAMARFVGGLAFASLILAPMYVAEIAPSRHRGKMVSINQLAIVVGFSAAYFSNLLLLEAAGAESGVLASWIGTDAVWRWMLGAEVVPAALFLIMLHFIPESPRWLIVRGRKAEALAILDRVAPPADRDAQFEEIGRHADGRRPDIMAQLRSLLGPRLRKPLVVGLVVGILQQITGVNAIYFYAPTIFEQSGVGTNAAFAQAVWVGLINVIFTVAAMLAIDRLGRKPLLMAGLFGVVVSMGVCGYGFATATYQLSPAKVAHLDPALDVARLQPMLDVPFRSDVAFKAALRTHLGAADSHAHEAALISAAIDMNPVLVLAGILGFVASFAFSLGPVMWVLFSEIFPNHMRGFAISVVGLVNSAVSFVVQLMFPWQLAHLGSATTFLIYGAFALLGLLLVQRLVPETKGSTLEQLEDTFGAGARQATPEAR